MSNAAKSMFFFGLYMAGEGLILFIAPHFLLGILGIPEAKDFWVKIAGLALCIFSFYYIRSAFLEIKDFFKITVHGRILQFILFVILFFTDNIGIMLVLNSSVELLSGIWTHFALKQDSR